jgi:hypothetical protein
VTLGIVLAVPLSLVKKFTPPIPETTLRRAFSTSLSIEAIR